ncbi:proline-rich extensin-like protein EPR1 [Penaeus japonicus]|uniref:proline-rich extensin-like protein EPR1 n=1 Tax=Penaeus japonicus TaxID=27405 RepID=UPI001C7109B9|nr:proline-rich extensin-like protein EPR1 [Penaeus japonicus]
MNARQYPVVSCTFPSLPHTTTHAPPCQAPPPLPARSQKLPHPCHKPRLRSAKSHAYSLPQATLFTLPQATPQSYRNPESTPHPPLPESTPPPCHKPHLRPATSHAPTSSATPPRDLPSNQETPPFTRALAEGKIMFIVIKLNYW